MLVMLGRVYWRFEDEPVGLLTPLIPKGQYDRRIQ